MKTIPDPSHSITLRLEIGTRSAYSEKLPWLSVKQAGISEQSIYEAWQRQRRDFTTNALDESHEKELVNAVKKLKGVRIIHVSDRAFLLHRSGKIEIYNKVPVKNPLVHEGFHCIFPPNLIIYKKICYGGNSWK